jgi:hypothetical protein
LQRDGLVYLEIGIGTEIGSGHVEWEKKDEGE